MESPSTFRASRREKQHYSGINCEVALRCQISMGEQRNTGIPGKGQKAKFFRCLNLDLKHLLSEPVQAVKAKLKNLA